MERRGAHFIVTIAVSEVQPILYKFIVDGVWRVNPNEPTIMDEAGNENNVIQATSPALNRQAIIYHTISYEMFTVVYPATIDPRLLACFPQIDKLLTSGQNLTSSMPIHESHDKILTYFKQNNLSINITDPQTYNGGIIPERERYGEDVCCTSELGWFDSRVDTTSVHVNFNYYVVNNLNLDWLKALLFVTVIHEMCHFVVFHSKTEPPTHSTFPEEPLRAEVGEVWEINNLGGIINHAALKDSPTLVSCLYRINRMGTAPYLALSCIKQLNMILAGTLHFPIILESENIDIEGLTKMKVERHCVEKNVGRNFIPYTGKRLVKQIRKDDKKGRR